jgi:hypothetical protein
MERLSCERRMDGGENDPALEGSRTSRGSARAKESVRQKFLMSCLPEDWLDLLKKYERAVA